jgi:hypothetical protein
VDFTPDPSLAPLRQEVKSFLAEQLTPELRQRVAQTGTVHDWGFHKALAGRGWIGAGWPVEYGGLGSDPWQLRVFYEECALADAPTDGLSMTLMVANTIRLVGSEAQKQEFLPKILAGEVLICLGYSEPEAGSDVAAAVLEAVADGDVWVLNGQKVFTSLAHEAQYVFLLARTSQEGTKHRGLTMFLVPMDSAGIGVEPIWTLGAPGRTNRTFYEHVVVADSARIGEVNGGWDVMKVALTFERGVTLPAVRALDQAVNWATVTTQPDGTRIIEDPLVRRRLAWIAIENEVATLLSSRATWVTAQGGLPGVEGSMAKLFTSESVQRSCASLLDVMARGGIPSADDPRTAAAAVEAAYRKAAVARIYGGTSEIMRSIIAEAGLGLPRTRSAS